MGIFGSKRKSNIANKPSSYAKVFNYIKVDSINGKNMDDYYWEYGPKKKGLLAGKVEVIYLTPGEYEIIAHGVTYQTTPTSVHGTVEAGINYILGANEDGLYFEYYGSDQE